LVANTYHGDDRIRDRGRLFILAQGPVPEAFFQPVESAFPTLLLTAV